jgi:hypothetical protein
MLWLKLKRANVFFIIIINFEFHLMTWEVFPKIWEVEMEGGLVTVRVNPVNMLRVWNQRNTL